MAYGVIFTALFMMTKYREKPYGRYLEGYGGIIGIGRRRAGGGMIAKVSWYSPKYLLFDAKKRGVCTLVAAMPDSITQLDAREGGVSFVPVDLDHRVTYAPEVMEWADEALGALARDHDWRSFLVRWKLKTLEQELTPRFPKLNGQAKPDSVVNVPTSISEEQILYAAKPFATVTPQERALYEEATKREESLLKVRGERSKLLLAKLNAMLDGSGRYLWEEKNAKGQKVVSKVDLDPVEVADMTSELQKQFEASEGEYKSVLVQGRVISAQRVASVIRGLPDAADVNGMKAEMEQRIRDEVKGEGFTMAKAMPVMLVLLGAALAFVMIYSVVK